MTTTLNHDTIRELRDYLDVAEMVCVPFVRAGHTAEMQCTLDETCARVHVVVGIAQKNAVALLRAHGFEYMSMGYSREALCVVATYQIIYRGHIIVLIAFSDDVADETCSGHAASAQRDEVAA